MHRLRTKGWNPVLLINHLCILASALASCVALTPPSMESFASMMKLEFIRLFSGIKNVMRYDSLCASNVICLFQAP
jgi:hypothetical protein